MPELRNKRWERFCQLIVYGADTTQKDAYIRAGYKARDNGAETSASRLFRIVQPVADRIHELQQEQKAQLAKRDRYTREALAERMVLASQIAEEDRIPSAIKGAEQAIAKLYGHIVDKREDITKPDYTQATSLHDVGVKMLQEVGYSTPSHADVALALDAHATLIAQLEAIAERAGFGANGDYEH